MKLASHDMSERIVAIGLLTKRDLRLLGPAFDRAWPVGDAALFEACWGRSMRLIWRLRGIQGRAVPYGRSALRVFRLEAMAQALGGQLARGIAGQA